MKLTTLGTSHGDPTVERFNSSNVLEAGGSMYIIDAGVPVNSLFVRKYGNDFSKIRAVFITHMHDDHIGGLPSFIKSLIKYSKEGQHTHIFLPEEAEKPLKEWLKAMHLENFENLITFHLTKEGMVYEDEVLKVHAIGTRHIYSAEGSITFAYRFEAERKTLLYTGDLMSNFADFPVDDIMEKGADLCVCESTHYKPEIAAGIVQNLPIKRMVFNHVWDAYASKEGEEKWLDTFSQSQFPCSIAHDGDVYEV